MRDGVGWHGPHSTWRMLRAMAPLRLRHIDRYMPHTRCTGTLHAATARKRRDTDRAPPSADACMRRWREAGMASAYRELRTGVRPYLRTLRVVETPRGARARRRCSGCCTRAHKYAFPLPTSSHAPARTQAHTCACSRGTCFWFPSGAGFFTPGCWRDYEGSVS
jgi:hypothetical protein